MSAFERKLKYHLVSYRIIAITEVTHVSVTTASQGCSGAGTLGEGGTASPTFLTGGRVPHFPHFFGLKLVQKLVHCCNWLLTKTQCKTISVQQN